MWTFVQFSININFINWPEKMCLVQIQFNGCYVSHLKKNLKLKWMFGHRSNVECLCVCVFIYGNKRLDWSSIVDNDFDVLLQSVAIQVHPRLESLHYCHYRLSFQPEGPNKMIAAALDNDLMVSVRHSWSIEVIALVDIMDNFFPYRSFPNDFPMFPVFIGKTKQINKQM